MSFNTDYLHSHSALERELRFPKNIVLVDTCYGDRFDDTMKESFVYLKKEYLKVPTLAFVERGGVFKNLMA